MRQSIISSAIIFIFMLPVCFSCNKEDNGNLNYYPNDSAFADITITSNFKYPLVFVIKDLSQNLETINLLTVTDTVPILRTYKIPRGLYQVSAWVVRDTANPFVNMLDSNSAWIKISAMINGKIVTEGIGEPLPGHPLQLVANIDFQYR